MLTKFNFLKDKIIKEKDPVLIISVLFVDSNTKGYISRKDIEELCKLTKFVRLTVKDTNKDSFESCKLSSLTSQELTQIQNNLDSNEICYITAKVSTKPDEQSGVQVISTKDYKALMSLAHFPKNKTESSKPKAESESELEIPV